MPEKYATKTKTGSNDSFDENEHILTLSKNSGEKEVKLYYEKVVLDNSRKARDMLKSGSLSIVGSPEFKGVNVQLKKDISAIILYHPNVAAKFKKLPIDILWHSLFYPEISLLRRALVKSSDTPNDYAVIKSSLLAKLNKIKTFYDGLILRLQDKMDEIDDAVETNSSVEVFLKNTLYSSFLSLGDVCRYRDDIVFSNETEEKTGVEKYEEAQQQYLKAEKVDCFDGRAYNQVATIAVNKRKFLTASYNYIKSIKCKKPFSTAPANLAIMLRKNVLESKEIYEVKANFNKTVKVKPEIVQGTVFLFLLMFGKIYLGQSDGDIVISESEISYLKQGLQYTFERKAASIRVCEAMSVHLIFLIEEAQQANKSYEKVAYFIDLVANAGFSHLASLKSADNASVASNGSLLVLISTLADYFGSRSVLRQPFSFSKWNAELLRNLASQAPLTALTARQALPEEVHFSSFEPLRKTYEVFVHQRGVTSSIKEKEAGPYRAKKVVSFIESMDTGVKFPQSSSSVSLENEPADLSDEEEILLIPQTPPEILKKIEPCADKNPVPEEFNFEEGLLTGYNDEEAMFSFDSILEVKHNSQDVISDDPPPGFGF